MTDDRKKFIRNINIKSTKLGKNKKILYASVSLVKPLNFYDYPYLWAWFGVPIIQLLFTLLKKIKVVILFKYIFILHFNLYQNYNVNNLKSFVISIFH